MALRLDRINRTWLMLFVAIIMALAAAWLTKQYLDVRERRIQEELADKAKGGPTAKVVVPRNNLPGGTPITGDMVGALQHTRRFDQSRHDYAGEFREI